MKHKKFVAIIFILLTTVNTVFAENNSSPVKIQIRTIQQSMREDLASGRIEQARNNLEQAAGNFHSVEIELGLIQTLMQAGEYRHALSAAAHTQAEHVDVIESTLFYAWLLAIGGQQQPVKQLLENALERNPDSDLLLDIKMQIKTHRLIASELTTTDNIQLKPFTPQLSATFKYIQSGVVLNDGIHIITSAPQLKKATTLKVINGLGETITAHRDSLFINDNLALLVLEKPVKISRSIIIANKPTYPGTPIYLIGYSQLDQNQAKWPQLKIDILGTPSDIIDSGYPIHVLDTDAGSGIYNQKGDLLGITSWNATQNNVMIPLDDVLTYLEIKTKNTSLFNQNKKQKSSTAIAMSSMDEIYERALTSSVQILGE